MKNKILDLRNHLFASLERLGDPDTVVDIQRENAIANTARVLIESAKVEAVAAVRLGRNLDSDFWREEKRAPLRLVGAVD